MKPGNSKPSLTWMLAIGGGLVAGLSMTLFDQGMAKVVTPAILIAGFAFASTYLTRARKRTGALAWLAGGLTAGICATVGRYVELTSAARDVLGADAAPEALAIATDAALADAKLPLMAIVFTIVTFLVALLPMVVGAVVRPKQGESAPLAIPA